MSQALTAQWDFNVVNKFRGRKEVKAGRATLPLVQPGRVPRVARLMALAIRFEGLLGDGVVKDYADLAHLGQVTRARISQVMNLRLLAPEIQEALLFLPRITAGRDMIRLADLQPIALQSDWILQRRMWRTLTLRKH